MTRAHPRCEYAPITPSAEIASDTPPTRPLVGILRRLREHPAAPVAVLAALLVLTGAFLLSLQRGMTFLVDEWALLAERRAWDMDTFFRPFYEHLFLVPILVFKVFMSTVGITPHWAYAVPLVALHLTCVTLVYGLARRRLGAWFALAPATLILFLWASYDNVLLPIQVSFLGSMAAGLGLLAVLTSRSRRRDGAGAALLALSLASSSVGLIFALAALVEILSRPHWRRRIWVVGAPAALYATWYLLYGPRGLQQGGSLESNLPLVPGHVADSAGAVFGALSGLGLEWGRILAALAGLALIVVFLRGAHFTIRSLSLLAALGAFWTLGGLARAHQDAAPEASRYLYPAAVFVVLIAVEALRSTTLGRRWAIVLTAALAISAVGNGEALRNAKNTHLKFSREISAQFAALETLGRENVDGDFVAGIHLAPLVDAREYFAMTDDLGSPVDVRRDLLTQGPLERRIGDDVLASALGMTRRRATVERNGPRPIVERATGSSVAALRACLRLKVLGAAGSLVVRPVREGVVVRSSSAPVQIWIRRFGEEFRPTKSAPVRTSQALALPPGGLSDPWRVRLVSRAPFAVCTATYPSP